MPSFFSSHHAASHSEATPLISNALGAEPLGDTSHLKLGVQLLLMAHRHYQRLSSCTEGSRVFEHETDHRFRPRSLIWGVLCFVLGWGGLFLFYKFRAPLRSTFLALVPGALIAVVASVLYTLANRKRNALVETWGVVDESDYEHPQELQNDEPARVPSTAIVFVSVRLVHLDNRVLRFSGPYPFRVGDHVLVLYEKDKPESAMLEHHWLEKTYVRTFLCAFYAFLALVSGCAVIWILN